MTTTDPTPAWPTVTAAATAEHAHARVMREFFAAFGEADEQRLAELMAADLVWHLPGSSPISGNWRGVDGLLNGVRAIATSLGRGRNSFELLKVYADDDSAVTVHRDTYTGDDNHLDLRYLLYVRFADGKMAEVWEVPFDQAENDRYFARQAATLARLPGQGGRA